MNRSDSEQKSASGVVASSTANTRLTGSRLIIARAVWLALLAAFFLVLFNITASVNNADAVALAYPILALPLSLVYFLRIVSLDVFLLLFPTGRLVPRWTGLILLLVLIHAFFNNFPSTMSPFYANWPGWLFALVTLVVYGAIISSQIYRYRRVSTPVQRQQMKCGVSSSLSPSS